MDLARQRASRALAGLGIDIGARRPALSGRCDFTTLTGFEAPRPHQDWAANAPLDAQLLILEAETGSGKTEAALWRFARLFEAGKVDSLYFAVPTRSAALQLHGRVNDTLRRLFGEQAPEAALAVPGYVKSGDAEGAALPGWQVRWDDAEDSDEGKPLARWAAENSKRYLAATVAVGTVDQAMLAGLQVKHAHLRAASLARSLLVIDEVHASDSYMTGVIGHLLKAHLGWGGHATLMSATLGSVARAKWLGLENVLGFPAALATPYPAVWVKGESGARAAVPQASEKRCGSMEQKQVSMSLVETMAADAAAMRAVAAARCGARVLVIRNTVTAAVDTWVAVRDAGAADLLLHVADGTALHHGCFAPEDRRLLDKAVERALVPKARSPGGVVVIGTQTLEQSLDIDADFLLTDLCPVDVLLQRIGRLHRRPPLARPAGFEEPQCVVLALENGLAPLLKPAFENGLGAWLVSKVLVGVYTNLSALELTRRLVKSEPIWTIPAMNRQLVEGAPHPERVEALHAELGKEWADYFLQIAGKQSAERGAARTVGLPVGEPFGEFRFPPDEETIRTRLGADGALVTFIEPVAGPFGQPVSGITLPSHWSHGLDTRDPVATQKGEAGLGFAIGDQRFHYDRRGVMRINS